MEKISPQTLTRLRQGSKEGNPGMGYYKELERILRDITGSVNGLLGTDSITCDNIQITCDSESITCDQEAF